MVFCEKGITSEVMGDALSCRCEKIIVWCSVALWKNRVWKTATGSETSCGWSRQCFMSSYTELAHRELDILKQELRRTCAVDRQHISI